MESEAPAICSGNGLRWFLLAVFLVLAVAGIVCWVVPVKTGIVRLVSLCPPLSLFAIVVFVNRKRRVPRALLCVCGLLVVLVHVLTLRASSIDPDVYAANLVKHEGVKYVWGGEGRFGIDCSGLIRKATVDSLYGTGRWGAGLLVWLKDCPAKSLGAGLGAYFEEQAVYSSVRDITNPAKGGIAITTSGVHVMAYLGDGAWIQASPSDGKVTVKDAGDEDTWFT